MLSARVYFEEESDPSSDENKEVICNAVKNYILDNWETDVSIKVEYKNGIQYVSYDLDL